MTSGKKIFAVLGTALALAGCQTGKDMVTDDVERSVTEALAQGAKDSMAVNVTVEYPVSGLSTAALEGMTSNIISYVFSPAVDSTYALPDSLLAGKTADDLGRAADAFVSSQLKNYRDTNLPLFEAQKGMADQWMLSWETALSGYFNGSHGNLATYMVDSYTYMGGAHGMSVRTPIVMSVRDGHIVRESDFFIPDSKDSLTVMLRRHLPDAFDSMDDYNMLFVKDIEPNGNYYVTEEGVNYLYGEYEIGPYSMGEISVLIPWDEVRSIVKREYR